MFPKRRAVAIYYGVPRKSVALEWQKDLLRFLPKGQGDIKEEKKESVRYKQKKIGQFLNQSLVGVDGLVSLRSQYLYPSWD